MSSIPTYTYRIRLTDVESVRAEKRAPDDTLRGEPVGTFGMDATRLEQLHALSAKAAYRPSEGEKAIVESEMLELGRLLYASLFDPRLANDFLLFYNEVVHNQHGLLRLELDIDETKLPAIAALPWEFLYVPENDITGALWLATAPQVILSRRRARWEAAKAIQLAPDEKLRIAIVVSAPYPDGTLGEVAYEKLYAEMEGLLQDLGDMVSLELMDPQREKATREVIDRYLERKPHIFHFIGHGRLNQVAGKDVGEIAVVQESGFARWVDAHKFSQLFARHRPSLVLLQSCEGGRLSPAQAFSGVASQIVQQSIPVVLAMQYEVTNATARKFAREFYQRLAKGEPVDKAVQEGRNMIAGWHENRDFATPVLFMRVRHGHLFELPSIAPSLVEPGPERRHELIPTAMPVNLADLREKLSRYFNLAELKTLSFDMGIDYDDFPNVKQDFVREFVRYCDHRERLPELIQNLKIQRPRVTWPKVPG